MRFVMGLALILLAAPLAPARAENAHPEKDPRPAVVLTAIEATAPVAPPMVASQVKIPSYEAALEKALAAQDMPSRGSFWWLVGVIVVAGVILALLVD